MKSWQSIWTYRRFQTKFPNFLVTFYKYYIWMLDCNYIFVEKIITGSSICDQSYLGIFNSYTTKWINYPQKSKYWRDYNTGLIPGKKNCKRIERATFFSEYVNPLKKLLWQWTDSRYLLSIILNSKTYLPNWNIVIVTPIRPNINLQRSVWRMWRRMITPPQPS